MKSVIFLDVGFSTRLASFYFEDSSKVNDSTSITSLRLSSNYSARSEILVPSPLNENQFQELRRKINESSESLNWVEFIGIGMRQEMIMPILTEYNGVYCYGPVKHYKSMETYGSLSYRNNSYDLSPFKEVEMTNLEDMKLYKEPIIIPFNNPDKKGIETKFKAKGNLAIEGESIKKSVFENKLMQFLTKLLSLLSATISLLRLSYDLLKKSNKKEQNGVNKA